MSKMGRFPPVYSLCKIQYLLSSLFIFVPVFWKMKFELAAKFWIFFLECVWERIKWRIDMFFNVNGKNTGTKLLPWRQINLTFFRFLGNEGGSQKLRKTPVSPGLSLGNILIRILHILGLPNQLLEFCYGRGARGPLLAARLPCNGNPP